MQRQSKTGFLNKKKAGMLFIAVLVLIWVSRLLHPFPYKAIGGGIWLVLFYAAHEDWKTHRIHEGVCIAIALLGAVYCLVTAQPPGHWGMGMGLSGLTMGLLYLLSRKAVGMGDVLLIIALGVYLGPFKSFYLLFHASWIGALAAVTGLLLKKLNPRQEIPFVPFIAAGYLLAISSL